MMTSGAHTFEHDFDGTPIEIWFWYCPREPETGAPEQITIVRVQFGEQELTKAEEEIMTREYCGGQEALETLIWDKIRESQ